MNLLITMSLLPSCFVLLSLKRNRNSVLFDIRSVDKLLLLDRILQQIHTSFNMWLFKIVFHLRWIWILVFFILGLLSTTVVWIWPGMKLPESIEFQLFRESHPFEQYDMIYKHQFWFEKILSVSYFANMRYLILL